jgi:hypothetical protein
VLLNAGRVNPSSGMARVELRAMVVRCASRMSVNAQVRGHPESVLSLLPRGEGAWRNSCATFLFGYSGAWRRGCLLPWGSGRKGAFGGERQMKCRRRWWLVAFGEAAKFLDVVGVEGSGLLVEQGSRTELQGQQVKGLSGDVAHLVSEGLEHDLRNARP